MNLIKLFEELLLEASPEEIYKKYYSDIPFNHFIRIVSIDPQSKVDNEGIKRIGKYSKLILNMFRNKNLKREDFPKVTEYLNLAYKHRIPLDANKILTLGNLYNLVKQYYVIDTKELSSILNALDENEYTKVFEGRKWEIFIPKNVKAACYLGVNTEWCTTWGKHSLNPTHKDRESNFETYAKQGSLFIIINKQNVDEKYQFHFETKQYMDRSDNKIDTEEFLSNNIEIRNYFFPSFVTKTNDETMNIEVARSPMLSTKDSNILLKRIVSIGKQKNPLVLTLINNNIEGMNNLIIDDDLEYSFQVIKNEITFTFKKDIDGELKDVYNVIENYRYGIASSDDRVRNEVEEWEDDQLKNHLLPLFQQYYQNNQSDIIEHLGTLSVEQFEEEYYVNFIENSDIKSIFINKFSDKNSSTYDSACQIEISEIENFISFDYGNRYNRVVYINLFYFLLYLMKHGITKINNNLIDVLENYIEEYSVPTSYDEDLLYSMNWVYPEYEDVQSDFEDYFDKLYEDINSLPECVRLRNVLNDVISKIFNGSMEFDNEVVYIKINSLQIDCDNGTINITYFNKKTNKKFSGKVKVDSLSSYATNYKLFETIIRFKEYIND